MPYLSFGTYSATCMTVSNKVTNRKTIDFILLLTLELTC